MSCGVFWSCSLSFLISRTALRPTGTRILKVQVRLLSSVKPERWTVPFGALYSDVGHLAKEVPSKLKTNRSEGRKKFASIAVFISRKLRIAEANSVTIKYVPWLLRRMGNGGERKMSAHAWKFTREKEWEWQYFHSNTIATIWRHFKNSYSLFLFGGDKP